MSVVTLVPHQQIPVELLNKLLDSFIGREGTDYGEVELTLEQKRVNLRSALERKDVFIAFDGESETFNLLTKTEIRNLNLSLD